jgi:hypothetical protein
MKVKPLDERRRVELSKSQSPKGLSSIKTDKWCMIHKYRENHFGSLWLGRKQKSQSHEGRRSKVTLSRRSKIGQPLDLGEEHVRHVEIHVNKTTLGRTHGTII